MSPQPIFADGIYRSSDAGVPIRRWCREHLQQWSVPHCLSRVDTSLGPTAVISAGMHTNRPPAVIVSGSGLNAATSLAAACALTKRRRVFLVDLPGQPGLSSSTGPPHGRARGYGPWLEETVRQLSTEPVVVLGHAHGAAVALDATPSPQFAGLVLVNPFGFVPARQSPGFRLLRWRWLIDPTMENSERLLSHLLSPRFVPDAALIDWFHLLGEHCTKARYDRPLPPETIRAWADYGTPVLVAAGSHDHLLAPDRLRERVTSLLDTDVKTMTGCGHLGLREAPAEIADLVDSVSSPA
ncbi:alpha/beta fold hydrolase [Rhodococcus erythropolis]|uniref:alpha/beta fold hydrolase n=1 Tax=Rhodococcus erythropolis TaxID=1833 RepID=UPI00031ED161|nr:alpha/beta hydrolase [Rhodococcus erythropolis]